MRWLLPLTAILALAFGASVVDRNPAPIKPPHERQYALNAQTAGKQIETNSSGEAAQTPAPAPPLAGAAQAEQSAAHDISQNLHDEAKWTDRVQAYMAIAIAAFTLILAIVSWAQLGHIGNTAQAAQLAAEAAKLSAEAALGVELPRFVVTEARMLVAEGDIASTLRRSAPIVYLQNHGKTSAEIVAECVHVIAGDHLPPAPHYTHVFRKRFGVMVEPGKKYAIDIGHLFNLGPQDVETLNSRRTPIWVFGLIGYRDFLGKLHTKRFSFRATGYFETPKPAVWNNCGLDQAATDKLAAGRPIYEARFMPDGPPEYNSEQYEEELALPHGSSTIWIDEI